MYKPEVGPETSDRDPRLRPGPVHRVLDRPHLPVYATPMGYLGVDVLFVDESEFLWGSGGGGVLIYDFWSGGSLVCEVTGLESDSVSRLSD